MTFETGPNHQEESISSSFLKELEQAREDGYESVKALVRQEDILATKEVCGTPLEKASWMNEKDWERLTVMRLYDEPTALHCIRTFLLAEKKLGECHVKGISLSSLIDEEVGTLENFYRACLFHDVGKCCLPHAVLNNSLNDADLAKVLIEQMEKDGDTLLLTQIEESVQAHYLGHTEDELAHFLESVHPVRYVKIRYILSEEEVRNITNKIPGIHGDSTLADAIRFHEAKSGDILMEEGEVVAAKIARGHHNYDNHQLEFPMASGLIGVSAKLEEFLAIADMYEALTAKRVYKDSFAPVKALSFLIKEVKLREINPFIAALWIQSELRTLDENILSGEERTSLIYIKKFAEEHQL